jgi:hypothetical protein
MASKLDKPTKALVLIAVLGILASLLSLYYITFDLSAQGTTAKVGEIIKHTNDTRLKRSDNIHWFQIAANETECFANDLLFAGKDSFATVKLLNGGVISLNPNSLISLSPDHIALHSGTIEIEVGKEPLKIESFGEEFEIPSQTQLRILNTRSEKRILPIKGDLKTLKGQKVLSQFLKQHKVHITAPQNGLEIPIFPDNTLNFSWQSSGTNNTYRVEFANNRDFTTLIHSLETTTKEATLPATTFQAGEIYWRVTDKTNKQQARSSFSLLTLPLIQLVAPQHGSELAASLASSEGILFQWTNPLKLPQKIQIATTVDFEKDVQTAETKNGQYLLKIQEPATYFWKAGYLNGNKSINWSPTSSFTLKPELKITPMEFRSFPQKIDFALQKSLIIEVHDPNKSAEYNFVILKGSKEILNITKNKPVLSINTFPDGEYTLKVEGFIKEGLKTKPLIRNFRVDTSKPIGPPKIKTNKKVKIFVQFIRKVFENIIPVAHASVKFFPLEWEGAPNAEYEIEIYKNNKRLLKKKIREPSFKFAVPEPGIYLWRLRMKIDHKWGQYSEFLQINAQDKVEHIDYPLMITPAKEAVITTQAEIVKVTLKWQEPFKDVKYFLELYSDISKRPFKTYRVKGGFKTFKFRSSDSPFYWRVYAVSDYKNQSTDTTKHKLSFNQKTEIKNDLKISLATYYVQSTFQQDISDPAFPKLDDETSLAGLLIDLNLVYFPTRWNPRLSLSLHARQSLLSSEQDSYRETRLGAEAGYLLKKSSKWSHSLYGGTLFSKTEVDFQKDASASASYTLNTYSLKYYVVRTISANSFIDSGLAIHLLPSLQMPPSLTWQAGYNYRFAQHWIVSLKGIWEKYLFKATLKENSSDDIQIQLQHLGLGAGLTWEYQ